MRTALLTGITGQDGSYLAELLLAEGYRVVGVMRPDGGGPERLGPLADAVRIETASLLDAGALASIIRRTAPDEIYNLAAQSAPHESWDRAVETGEVTGLGVVRLLDAMRAAAPEARFCQAGSSEIFGRGADGPLDESSPLHPRSPYGAAKAYAHWITASYRETLRLHASSAILFNHESPRRGIGFVTRKITDGVARIRAGLQRDLRLGNLEARRDWGYAPDYVRAMWLMLQQERPSDFVIGTGETHSVRDFCEIAFASVGLDYRDHVVQDERFVRRTDGATPVADATRARETLGWRPTVTFRQLVEMMVESDLARYAGVGA